jgi:hypothetical protein
MQTDVYLILLYIGILLSVPLFFIDDFEYKKLHRILFGVIVMVTFLETFGAYTGDNGIQNVIYYNLLFVYLETILILYFFFWVFPIKKAKKYTAIAVFVFFIWSIIYSLFFQSLFVFHNVSYVIGGVLLISFCMYFFYGLMKEDWYQDKNLLALPIFWIVTMIMFFYSGSLLYFASFRFISGANIELMIKINYIIQALSVLMYWVMGTAFYIPFWLEGKQPNVNGGLNTPNQVLK